MGDNHYDAAVVGSGPNGLAAAIVLAQAGLSVIVFEARDTPGGGVRTAELTLPGFHHDVCSAIYPMGVGSPFFSSLPLSEHGLEWVHPEAPLGHPLDDGSAVMLERSLEATGEGVGDDGSAYLRLMQPLVEGWSQLAVDALGPLAVPRHPWLMAKLGLRGMRSAESLCRSYFAGPRARALLAGICAHSILPLERSPSAAIGVMLGLAGHAVGWPMPKGGAGALTRALVSYLESLGGVVRVGAEVARVEEVPTQGPVLFDTSPRAMLQVAGHLLPPRYHRALERFRYGAGVCKVDWALDGPIPWKAPDLARAATVHVGGTFEEIAAAERAPYEGVHAPRPFVLLAQQSLFDPRRAPSGKHTGWAYCHVPPGSSRDCTEAIEDQVERFAPGFKERVLHRHTMTAADFAAYNANYVGGDISGGIASLGQLFTRPVARWSPYTTPNPRLYLCSSSTPPGGGVHGMCGVHAARAALKRLGIKPPV